jgi:hypothetical protein
LIAIAACVTCISQAAPVPETCHVTKAPDKVFVPPPPHDPLPPGGTFYFGSDDLWVFLPNDGVWDTLRDGANYDRRKIAWFSKGYRRLSESQNDLDVEARRLDGAESVQGGPPFNVLLPETKESFMFSGIAFPATGCWEVSAWYQKSHELKFVVWVTP